MRQRAKSSAAHQRVTSADIRGRAGINYVPGLPKVVPNPKAKLLDQVREVSALLFFIYNYHFCALPMRLLRRIKPRAVETLRLSSQGIAEAQRFVGYCVGREGSPIAQAG